MTHGRPWVQGRPWEVSKEPNDTRHVGYQFYSDFSTENKYRVNTQLKLKFWIRLPWGDPPGPWPPQPWPPKENKKVVHERWNLFFYPSQHKFGEKNSKNFKDSKDRQMLKLEEISPKLQRMQILRKLAPLLPPVYSPPGPPGGQKNFWEVSGI